MRAAGLPYPELLHMGFEADELSGEAPPLFCRERAVELLGRVAWDAQWGNLGFVWAGIAGQQVRARRLGEAVAAAWFTA